MLFLETQRLLVTATKSSDDKESIDSTVINNIYLKSDVTLEQAIENKEILKGKRRIGEIKLEFVGNACYIFYDMSKEYRENGYATETLRGLRDYCVAKGKEPRVSICSRNKKSQNVASRCGFCCEELSVDGSYDVWVYKKGNMGFNF